ncbi:transport system permease [Bordetella pertussis]|uniref:Transport system permease protein n=3 Tax=Bordetella pertussis TaxID=520 RepID=Q7VSR7_BORPE|nr:ABC transporter permease [Bordetella pertussis]ETH41212.1 ABC transporter, permease protein [Bordetella pertussis H918]ETH43839.1 ABC transporter, permease protein [Bordetella pertussis H939]ETH48757.1 ABC transporter, permease protein [Bordetella pertussis H921]ETH73336.1 ABC transporter, permease protein [Bordetella pertussis STO1-CHLA-0011]ETH82312.1 ABC transporter, permease protein [Bordetella pertussis STO1-CHOC-0017]ETH87795.1 ABC transporter, permease protein [Bordetella pertussis 
MLATIIRRLLQTVVVMLVMSALVFAGIYMVGDPVSMLASPEATEAQRTAIRVSLGLNQPLWKQYLIFMGQAVRGDFGNSFLTGEPAMRLILERMLATLELACVAMLLSVLIGVPLGIRAGLKPKAPASRVIMTGSVLGFSLPNFWVGLMLIMIFAVTLGWLPASGRGQTVSVAGLSLSVLTLDGWASLILPAATIALAKCAMIIRVTRAATRESLPQDYIKFARAKGLPEKRVLGVHLLKNILIPIVTVAGLEFGQVVEFAVVTETVFSWPGMGKLLIDSIINLDRPVVVAYLLLIVFFLVMLNLVVNIIYTVLDPRVRLDSRQ